MFVWLLNLHELGKPVNILVKIIWYVNSAFKQRLQILLVDVPLWTNPCEVLFSSDKLIRL